MDNSQVVEVMQPETSEEQAFFDALHPGEFLEIKRTAPWGYDGYLGTVTHEEGIDLAEEIKRVWGGGTYALRRKSRNVAGRILYGTKTITIKIAGNPKGGSSAVGDSSQSTAMAMLPPGAMPAGMHPTMAADMQSALLKIITDRFQAPAESLKDVAQAIQGVMAQGGQVVATAQVDPLKGILQAAETYKELKKVFGKESRESNPDDEDDDEDEPGDMMGMLGKVLLNKFMGGESAPAPQAPAPGDAPPGWARAPNGQWVQVQQAPEYPPGWVRAPNGQWVPLKKDEARVETPRRAPVPREPLNVRSYPDGATIARERNPTSSIPTSNEEIRIDPGNLKWPSPETQTFDGHDVPAMTTHSPQSDGIEGGLATVDHVSDEEEEETEPCPECEGTGKIEVEQPEGYSTTEKCEECDGTGQVEVNPPLSPEEIAEEIEGMDDEEQVQVFALLGPKFGIPSETMVELVKQVQEAKAKEAEHERQRQAGE